MSSPWLEGTALPIDVEEAVSGVRRALKEARRTIAMMVERGDYEAAIEALTATMGEAISRLGEALVLSVRGLRENIDRLAGKVDRLAESIADLRDVVARHDEAIGELTKNVAELTEDVRELTRNVARHEGAVREFRGWRAERNVADSLEAWLRRRAPEYEVIRWFKTGVDVLIEGKGVFAAVEITTVPYKEAVDKVKNAIGVIKEAWGREPDVLIIWSESGVVPPEVADYAAKRGVEVVRGEKELKRLLDGVAGARPTA